MELERNQMSNPINVPYVNTEISPKDQYTTQRQKVIDLTSPNTGHRPCPWCKDTGGNGLLVKRVYENNMSWLCCGICKYREQIQYESPVIIAPSSDTQSTYSDYGASAKDSSVGPLICATLKRGGNTRQHIEQLQQASKKKVYEKSDLILPRGGHVVNQARYHYDTNTQSWSQFE